MPALARDTENGDNPPAQREPGLWTAGPGDGGRGNRSLPSEMCLGSWNPTWESGDESPLPTHSLLHTFTMRPAHALAYTLAAQAPILIQGWEETASLQEALETPGQRRSPTGWIRCL